MRDTSIAIIWKTIIMIIFIGIYPRDFQFIAPTTFLIFGLFFYILIDKIIKTILEL